MQATTVRSAASLALPCSRHPSALSSRSSVARCPVANLSLATRTRFPYRFRVVEDFDKDEAALDAALDGLEEVVEETKAEETEEATVEELNEAPAASSDSDATPAGASERFSLNFLWMDRNIGVAVDHCYGKQQKSPLTEYFFWPRTDAWEELKACLEGKPWVSERDKVLLLNQTTEVINFWQDEETKHTMQEAREEFAGCKFDGH